MSPAIYGLMASACVALGLVAVPMLRDRGPLDRLGPADGAEDEQERSGLLLLLERFAAWLGPHAAGLMSAGRRRSIERRLNAAGRPGGMTVQRYLGIQAAAVVLAAGFFGFLLLLGSSPVFLFLGVLMGWIGPEMWLSRTARIRQERIERHLPDFLDILAVTVRAGLGYRLALQRVAESLGGPVGDEMITALRQMSLGVPRREAFESLRQRNHSESLKSFVAAQLQAEELGVPLADALNDIASDMRRMAHQNARRRAQRAAPRVSLITTTLIVPGAIILLLVSLALGSGVTESGLLGG